MRTPIATLLAVLGSFGALWPLAAQEAEGVPVLATRELEISTLPVATGAAPVTGYQLWFTRDGGRSWEKAPTVHTGAPPLAFSAPSDGTYGFRVVAIDRSGRGDEPPQPGTPPEQTCIVDTQAPQLEVQRPLGAEPLYAGSWLAIEYTARDANLGTHPVRIEWRKVGEEVWQDVLPDPWHAATRNLQWWPPVVSGQLELRVTAVDRAGQPTQWTTPTPIPVLEFDGFTASRAVAAEPYSAFRRFPLFYRIPEFAPIEVRTVEVWWRHGSGPWQLVTDADRTSPYRFEAHDEGAYHFYVRALSQNGVPSRPEPSGDTPPDHRTVVDTLPPSGVVRLSQAPGQTYHRTGEPLEISWDVLEENLAPTRCRVEYSLDRGASWHTLAERVEFRGGLGSLVWHPPQVEIEELRLRLVARDLAGNESSIEADSRVHLIHPAEDPALAAETHYQRALFLARQGAEDSWQSAVELLGVSLSYVSSNPEVWHDRGVLRMRLGRPLEALADFQRAHALKPQDLGVTFALVRAHVNVQRSRLEPEVDHLRAAREVLASVSRMDIYREPNFRELMASYNLLAEATRLPADAADRTAPVE